MNNKDTNENDEQNRPEVDLEDLSPDESKANEIKGGPIHALWISG